MAKLKNKIYFYGLQLFIIFSLFVTINIFADNTSDNPKTIREVKDPGLKVLMVGQEVAFVQKELVVGSCWDFVNMIYNNAGYPSKKRKTVFHSQKSGPYADINQIRVGDWIMMLNQEFNNVEHSCIFVKWVDKFNKIAMTLDYVGMKRHELGKYDQHNLSKVFAILRPGDQSVVTPHKTTGAFETTQHHQ